MLVDAYHEFSFPREMLASIRKGLKPGGRVFLLEDRAEDPLVPIKPLHKMTQKQAKREYAASGFEWVETRDFLPWQHFMIFRKPETELEKRETKKEEAPDNEKANAGS